MRERTKRATVYNTHERTTRHEKTTIYTIQTVKNAFILLEALTEYTDGLTLIQLAGILRQNRNRVFRLITTLCENGLVEHDEVSGLYRLGIYSLTLGQKFLQNANVVNFAHPIMEDLARKHHEAVYMTVIREDEVVFVDMVDCEQHIKTASLVGKRFPFFNNAAGKVIRALDSRELLEKLFKKWGRKGVPDMDSLEQELEEIRAKGVAVDRGGLGEGIISVAVAVRDYAGKVVGAITLIGPSFRMLAERIDTEIIPSMIEGAELLSGRFGYARAG